MFFDRLGEPITVGSVMFDEEITLLVVVSIVDFGLGLQHCFANILESGDLSDKDIGKDVSHFTAPPGHRFKDIEVVGYAAR